MVLFNSTGYNVPDLVLLSIWHLCRLNAVSVFHRVALLLLVPKMVSGLSVQIYHTRRTTGSMPGKPMKR